MSWVSVDSYNKELIFFRKPRRIYGFWVDVKDPEDTQISLPRGSIKKLIGRELTWEDEPVELKEE